MSSAQAQGQQGHRRVGKQCIFLLEAFVKCLQVWPAGICGGRWIRRDREWVLDPELGWREAQLSPCLPGKQPLPAGGEGKWWMLARPAAPLLAQA